MNFRSRPAAASTLCAVLLAPHAAAQSPSPPSELEAAAPWFYVRGQATVVTQGRDAIHAPYSGPNSLRQDGEVKTSLSTTLFLGARLRPGTELYFDPEVSGGKGLSGVHGIAGFPNGEITRVAEATPQAYVARCYVRQIVALGSDTEARDEGLYDLPGRDAVDRIEFRLGKFAATDVFDDNRYSHDQRTQFLNWGLMSNGAWDFPADVRGYTLGGSVELHHASWALRYGAFAMPRVANGAVLDGNLDRALGHALEGELDTDVGGRPGAMRLLLFRNGANMGHYRDAIASAGGGAPDITTVRQYSDKYGIGLNLEQQLSDVLGSFARLGWNDGNTESFTFTEIDRTASLGISLDGRAFGRDGDAIGVAVVANGLSSPHRDYLAAGGSGFILGDGALSYREEVCAEVFYRFRVLDKLNLTADVQYVQNPGYNADRGPVEIFAIRAHVEF